MDVFSTNVKRAARGRVASNVNAMSPLGAQIRAAVSSVSPEGTPVLDIDIRTEFIRETSSLNTWADKKRESYYLSEGKE